MRVPHAFCFMPRGILLPLDILPNPLSAEKITCRVGKRLHACFLASLQHAEGMSED